MLTIIGAGLTGATIARLALDDGYPVQVIERRAFVGGNTADAVWANGQRYNLYGPHYFRTSSDLIWKFVNRFSPWRQYSAVLSSLVDGKIEAFPIQASYIDKLCGRGWRSNLPTVAATNFEEACLRHMPREVYDCFVYGYTKKQWGCEPSELSADLAARVEVRGDGDRRLKSDKYQGFPIGGYCAMVESMLAGADVRLKTPSQSVGWGSPLVYTGGIDQFFGYTLGHLPYRTQEREHRSGRLSCMQLNYPDMSVPHIREMDWRFSWDGPGFVTTETPRWAQSEEEREYPYPSAKARAMYDGYAKLAAEHSNVLFAGRLGEYRYYDMDHAIMRAMTLYGRWVKPRLVEMAA